MSRKPVRLRALAHADVENAIEHYLRAAEAPVAVGFIDALEAAYRGIAAHPAAGSPRYGHELAVPGLRSRGLKRYPHLVFYMERDDHIEVWRVLHAERDIPARMREAEG